MRLNAKSSLLLACLLAAAAAWAGKPLSPQAAYEASLPEGAPRKLSDVYKFFTQALGEGLGAKVQAANTRVRGRSWELLSTGNFPEVELSLRPFEAQGLKFEKADFLFRRLSLDKESIPAWKLKLLEVREVQSRLVFSLRSLAARLSELEGAEVHLQAELQEQRVILSGPGRLLLVPCQVEARCRLDWDESSRSLRLVAEEKSFGGRFLPRWLWWLGWSPVPSKPVLDLGFSWIPFNIQEVHVGWDQVNLSTNW